MYISSILSTSSFADVIRNKKSFSVLPRTCIHLSCQVRREARSGYSDNKICAYLNMKMMREEDKGAVSHGKKVDTLFVYIALIYDRLLNVLTSRISLLAAI